MDGVTDALRASRDAYGRRDWTGARDGFRAAALLGELSADDLRLWGDAAWWLGLVDESMRAYEQAYGRYLTLDRRREAARAALGVGGSLFLRGDEAAGSGWLNRARRLLAGLSECAEHGLIQYLVEVEGALDGPDLDRVVAAARQVQEIGRRVGDRNLEVMGVVGAGQALVRQGRVPQGMAALDEALAAVLAGELDPDWAGNVYCHLIAACYELADLRRARECVKATERWLAALPAAVVFSGICRIHRSQLMRIRGAWDAAEREAARVCSEVADIHVSTAAEAHYTLGEIHRLRGDLSDAEAEYLLAHGLGRDPQPGLAQLRLAQGRSADAASSIRTALAAAPAHPLARAPLCAAQVEIALATGDPATARKAGDELAETATAYGSPGLIAAAGQARGAALLAERHPAEALAVLHTACREWRELDAPYETARVRVLLARAYRELDDEDAATRELDAAQRAFEHLGAAVLREPMLPDRLTEREAQVLALVAAGRTNRQIAGALAIAEKTVARHLSNIFAKTGVGSRTEAAAYAFGRGLATPPRG